MISRVYVMQRGLDNRAKIFLKSWRELGLKGKVADLRILDSYTLEHELGEKDLQRVADSLTNQILENFSINELPSAIDLRARPKTRKKFNYGIEIGYLPGVTDNIGHTVKQTAIDLLHLDSELPLKVYTSKVFLILGTLTDSDIGKISSSLYNPLIETSDIVHFNKNKKLELPLRVPEVKITPHTPVLQVPLQISDKELVKIGKVGIKEEDGTSRSSLALELPAMKAIQAYFAKLKRDPTDIELEALAQTWSEHCKHTIFGSPIDDIKNGLYKTFIKGATEKIRKQKGSKDFCVSVFSDNSGGIIFDNEYLISHKVETHNSPSALDPFGGAITGIGGVNRDAIAFGLGAKPVANTYGFCFGNPEDKKQLYLDKEKKQKMFLPKRIMEGVVKGINAGGNTSGIPTISGFVRFDDRFKGKPLVFAGTVGLIPRKINGKLSHEKSALPGDYVVMIGGRVGKDGIKGATFSSLAIDDSSPIGAVQIGDPITQKKLSDAIVKEAREMELYHSITDNGAGGLSSSVGEMAKESGGVLVNLEKVPLKYPGLRPWEIWISESQERMTLAVPKEKWSDFHTLMQKRDVEATVIGEFTNSGNCVVRWSGHDIMDISLEFLHNGLPKQHLETSSVSNKRTEPKLPSGTNRTKVFEELLKEKNVSGLSFISEQYDHEVQSSSVLKPLSGRGRINTDAQVFRPVLSSEKGVVMSYGLYPSYGDISMYDMTACALDTAIRNNIAAGGTLKHLALLDNFCWCSSYDKKRLGQLVKSVKACYDYAVQYRTPFISGKDSMFNDFHGYDEKGKKVDISIPPTILISSMSVMPSLYKAVSPEFKNEGDLIYVLGETHDELGASEYFKLLVKNDITKIGNGVPEVNVKKNLQVYTALEKAIDQELLASSMSITSGGLSTALAKASVGGKVGCQISLDDLPGDASNIDAKLFSESQGRILVSVSKANIKKFEKIIKNIPFVMLGKVEKSGKFMVRDNNTDVIKSNIKKLCSLYHNFSNQMS